MARPCRRATAPLLAIASLVTASLAPARSQVLPPPAPPAASASATARPVSQAIVRLQGGNVAANAAMVLEAAVKAGAVSGVDHTLARGQSVCAAYKTEVGLPGCRPETLDLARQLNPGLRSLELVRSGQTIRLPDAELGPYEYVVRLDPTVRSQQAQIQQKTTAWSEFLLKEEKASDGTLRLTFRGFEIRLPVESDEKLNELLRALAPLRSPNVLVAASYASRPVHKKYAFERPDRFFELCEQGGAPVGDEGDLRLYLGSSQSCQSVCRTEDDCPEVILVDTPVDPHPDLMGALLPAPPAAPPTDADRVCSVTDFDERLHHGSHLAGIVGARANGFGFVGMDPAARIVVLSRDDTDDTVLADYITERSEGPDFPVYLFASSWDNPPLSTDDARFWHNVIAKTVQSVGPFWIAAAGDEGVDLTARWQKGPQNMGDLLNVVLVTACDPCGPNPSLIATANRSAKMVHVAAPGREIPSTVGSSQYARASGTSQAAAFVAGVASAMKGCYPNRYVLPHQIKTRLQVTSRPFPATAPGQPRKDAGLAAGVLDPDLALRDPAEDWVKIQGAPLQSIRIRRWAEDDIAILNPVSRQSVPGSPVRTKDVRRLVRVPGPGAGAPDQWVVYSRVGFDDGNEHRGEVVRTGPGVLPAGRESRTLLETCDGRKLAASQVEDVLVRRGGPPCP